jgi:GntR family transcriptional regulator, arabinose operon transcriptional repressor
MSEQHIITSKHSAITTWIKQEIEAGRLRPGDKLPSESEICARFGVSRSSARQAISNLAHAGWVESRKGVGTYCLARRSPEADDFALVCYYASSYIFPRIAAGFEIATQRGGFHMILNQTEANVEKEKGVLLRLRERGVRGIAIEPVIAGSEDGSDLRDLETTNYRLLCEIQESGIQVVLMDNTFGDSRFPAIVLDDIATGALAARYLAERGHRDIAIVYSPLHRPFRLRRQGATDYLAGLGVEVPADRLLSVGPVRECDAFFERYFDSRPRLPESFFCCNDEMSIALFRAAHANGYSIPADFSVISVDNSDYAQLPGISLTSIDHPDQFIGEKAAQILLDGVITPNVHYRSTISIDPVVVERSSVKTHTGAPAPEKKQGG